MKFYWSTNTGFESIFDPEIEPPVISLNNDQKKQDLIKSKVTQALITQHPKLKDKEYRLKLTNRDKVAVVNKLSRLFEEYQ
jgi:hypothetical protein